jgi:hypothetical protein
VGEIDMKDQIEKLAEGRVKKAKEKLQAGYYSQREFYLKKALAAEQVVKHCLKNWTGLEVFLGRLATEVSALEEILGFSLNDSSYDSIRLSRVKGVNIMHHLAYWTADNLLEISHDLQK